MEPVKLEDECLVFLGDYELKIRKKTTDGGGQNKNKTCANVVIIPRRESALCSMLKSFVDKQLVPIRYYTENNTIFLKQTKEPIVEIGGEDATWGVRLDRTLFPSLVRAILAAKGITLHEPFREFVKNATKFDLTLKNYKKVIGLFSQELCKTSSLNSEKQDKADSSDEYEVDDEDMSS